MDRKRTDFAEDLGSLADDVKADVGDMLQVLRERRNPTCRRNTSLEAEPSETNVAKHAPETESSRSTEVTRCASAGGSRIKVLADAVVPLENVTTRLRVDTNELLSEAALRQKLAKRTPDTRQDIIEAALQLWFRTEGYGKA